MFFTSDVFRSRRRTMTAVAALIAVAAAVALVAGSLLAVRRRRREHTGRLAIATPGGRALANNLGTLSDFRMELQLPRTRR
jgi:hypothetical protein